jgi:hypothetical protein
MLSLAHPNIVRVDGVHRSARNVWLAMEYVDGGDLSRLRGRPAVEIVRIVQTVAEALAHAHRAGVVHRDLKPSNVLLTAAGSPRIADFGMALGIAAFPEADAGRGSLYTMSPQQLDGAPASPSDDVYGLGAMLYELLTGYPPFYPDATPERIRSEPAAKPAAPPTLAGLIQRMLAKSREERPDMGSVARELNAASAALHTQAHMSNEDKQGRQEPIRIAPPGAPSAAPGEPLRPEWRRAADGARTGGTRPGMRRVFGIAAIAASVAALAIVFFALPRLVQQKPPRPAATATPLKPQAAPTKEAQIDFAALARAKQDADEKRLAVDERVQKLTERGADQWGAADHQAAMRELASGDAAYEKREYAAAAEHFGNMAPLVDALETRADVALKEQLQAGAQAIDAGRTEDAKAAFTLAAKIDPGNQAAAQGLKRTGTLDEVLRLVVAGERLEAEGDVHAAVANFRKALSLDPLTARASSGAARIEARLAGDAFASAMARGYAALASSDHASARAAFEQARRIRPDAPEIGQAMRQIEQEQRTGAIAAKLAQAQTLEQSERWADALKEYRAVIELDPTIAAANEGVRRTEPRAQLNEQLEMYLTQPERLFSQPVRASARDALTRANAIPNPGPLLSKQMATLSDWVARADVPVAVALESDNLTHVTIYRVGELGAFAQRSLELVPGSYTVVGTRPGYRDVRRQINVTPGAPAEPIVIRCEDRI